MPTTSIYRASEACALAGIDNKRFNETVAKEAYPCAPPAMRGSARKFTENDVVALFVYARLIEQGIHQRVAGQVACRIKSEIDEDPAQEEIRVEKFSEHGSEKPDPKNGILGAEYSTHVHWIFDVGGIRKYLRAAPNTERPQEDK